MYINIYIYIYVYIYIYIYIYIYMTFVLHQTKGGAGETYYDMTKFIWQKRPAVATWD